MTVVPVVFACDDNYAMPFAVTVESLLANKAEDTFYDIYCMIPGFFSQKNIDKVNSFKEHYDNFQITFIDMKKEFEEFQPIEGHISYVAYYRLAIASKIIKYDKCIYLDVDMIVTTDLSELYNVELNANYLGAVAHPRFYYGVRHSDKIKKGEYFNSGQLLMNLRQIRNNDVENQFLALMKSRPSLFDQDILNIVCHGKILYLPLKYNAITNLVAISHKKIVSKMYGRNYMKILSNPAIIHYTDKEKPWNFSFCYHGKIWDKYFKQSPYADQKLSKNFWSDLSKNKNKIRKWFFRFKWKKDFKVIRILGKYFIYERDLVKKIV